MNLKNILQSIISFSIILKILFYLVIAIIGADKKCFEYKRGCLLKSIQIATRFIYLIIFKMNKYNQMVELHYDWVNLLLFFLYNGRF